MAVDPLTGGPGGAGPALFVRYRRGQCSGMRHALDAIRKAHEDWGRLTGRHHAPLIERYRMDDAEFAIVTLGSMTGAAKDAVDEARARGRRVGLVKVKTFRPFPAADIAEALDKLRAFGVVDRSVDFGWNCGPLYRDVVTALQASQHRRPSQSFIGGLAGADLTVEHFLGVIETVGQLQDTAGPRDTIWLNAQD